VIQADVLLVDGHLTVSATLSSTVDTGQTEGTDPDGFKLDAFGRASADASLKVDFTVSGTPLLFACAGDARIQLRHAGFPVFVGSGQATLQPGSYSLYFNSSAGGESWPPGINPNGLPPSSQEIGSATCS
jgi:hypothetical protein